MSLNMDITCWCIGDKTIQFDRFGVININIQGGTHQSYWNHWFWLCIKRKGNDRFVVKAEFCGYMSITFLVAAVKYMTKIT